MKLLINKRYFVLLLKIVVSFSLMTWLFTGIKWFEITVLLGKAKLIWVLFAFAWVVISVLVSAYKWQLITKASALSLPFSVLWRSYWAGLFFNNFLPSSIGGDALRIYWSGKYSGDMAGATTSVVVERVLATIGLSFLALVATPIVNLQVPYLTLFFFMMTVLGLAILTLILYPKLVEILQGIFSFWPKFTKFLHGVSVHGKRLRRNHLLLVKALVWSVIFQGCVIMVNYSVFRALNITQVSLLQAIVLIPATSAAAMVPIGINGYGTREGAYVALFTNLGVSKAGAMTASIMFALIVSISSLWGGWVWVKEAKSIKRGINCEKYDTGESSQIFC